MNICKPTHFYTGQNLPYFTSTVHFSAQCYPSSLQPVCFTPPREITPPPVRQTSTMQSYQTLTLGGATEAATPFENGLTNGYTEDEETVPPPVVKSAAKISLRQA